MAQPNKRDELMALRWDLISALIRLEREALDLPPTQWRVFKRDELRRMFGDVVDGG